MLLADECEAAEDADADDDDDDDDILFGSPLQYETRRDLC